MSGPGDAVANTEQVEFWDGVEGDDNDIARKFLDPVDPETAARALDAVRATLRAHERPDGLFLDGAAWLVTAQRP